MEDILDVYARPFDPERPVVCVDETTKELRSTPRGSLPVQAERPEREDYVYERHGTANVFLSVEPLAGRRQVRLTERHTKLDFAEELRCILEDDYPNAERVVLITDNLNTHGVHALYEAFEPELSTAPKNWVFAALGEANSGGHTQEWTCLFAFRVLATSPS